MPPDQLDYSGSQNEVAKVEHPTSTTVLLKESARNTHDKTATPRAAVDHLVVWTPAGDEEVAPVSIQTPVEWRPLVDHEDTAPAIERFSTARYQPSEWTQFNYQTLSTSRDTQRDALLTEAEARRCIASAAARSEADQRASSRVLSARAHEVHGAQSELARASWLCREEEELLETQRQRLRRAVAALTRPRAISTECLARRYDRLEQDLVRDGPEQELHKEIALLDDVQNALQTAVKCATTQLSAGRAARDRLERDWGGKSVARHLETVCLEVNTARPRTAMLHPACTRLPHGQSTPLHWEAFTRENLSVATQERQASRRMRDDVEQLVTSAARALRNQADAVEMAFERRIAETDECLRSLEDQLTQILARISETERLLSDLRFSIANHGVPLRVAHTRLETRLQRPGVELCRDEPQHGLVNEVRRVEETLLALRTRFSEAETSLANLIRVRGRLEHDIRIKRHSLTIDRGRCRELRLAFPSTVHLTGY